MPKKISKLFVDEVCVATVPLSCMSMQPKLDSGGEWSIAVVNWGSTSGPSLSR